jgi:hypothetical protein
MKGGATREQLDRFWEEVANARSYDEALRVVMGWVNVS